MILPISAAIAGLTGYIYFLALNTTLPSLSGPIQEGFYGIIIAALVNYEPVFILFSTFLISLFISPLQFNAFMYLKNPQIALVILATSIYIIGTYPFIWSLYYNNAAFYKKEEKTLLLNKK